MTKPQVALALALTLASSYTAAGRAVGRHPSASDASWAGRTLPLGREPISEPVALKEFYAEAAANLSTWRTGLYGRLLRAYNEEVLARKPTAGTGELQQTVEPLGHNMFQLWQPAVTCPGHQSTRRYGQDGDGGKQLCPISELKAPCTIFSLGSNNDVSFEEAMLEHTPCQIHTFDCTVDLTPIHTRHHFHKKCLGGARVSNNLQFVDMKTAVTLAGATKLDLLKMDIEMAEHLVLSSWTEHTEGLPAQIAVEIHYDTASLYGTVADYKAGKQVILKSRQYMTLGEQALLASHLANLGYGVVAREDNPLCSSCTELALLRVEHFRPASGHQYT